MSCWPPARIALLTELTAAGNTDQQIANALGISRSAVAGARFRLKIPSTNSAYPRRDIPADFAECAPLLTVKESAARWSISTTTVRKWYKATETTPLRPERQVVTSAPRLRKCAATPLRRFKLPERGPTMAARAQLFLQHHFPVFRASTIDPKAPGGVWIMAGRRVSEADLLNAAYRKGFRPEAMAA